jgi:hypothetical protein
MPKRKITCYHTELLAWVKPIMPPWHGETCDCGQNWCCPVCGFGQGSYPCDCNRDYINNTWNRNIPIKQDGGENE